MGNPIKPISTITLAKKTFLYEFEKLIINMIRIPKQTYSASKLAKGFEVLEPGYTYFHQWDNSSVGDLFFTLYKAILRNENFEAKKNNALLILNSIKINIIKFISIQCKKMD